MKSLVAAPSADRLTGKVALVTGAGRGIGKAIARQLASEGATVAINDLNGVTASETADEILAMGRSATAHVADISSINACVQLVADVTSESGRLDILVNNAGIDPVRDWLEVDDELWERVVNTNLRGAFFCSQAAAREMQKIGGGRIINISSVHARLTMTGYSVYSASKGGLEALTRQMALELAPLRITVNAVAPGCIQVEKSTYAPQDRSREIPSGRVGMPRDIAAAITFLASDEMEWLTGQVITIDGGTTTRLFLKTNELPSV